MTLEDRRIRRPEEGWLTLGLVIVLAVTLAWAIDEPRWVNGKGELTDCLALFALGGVAVGFIGPKVGWGRWTTHLVGALFAGLVIPIVAGLTAYPGTGLADAFLRTADGSIDAYLDIAWRGLAFTDQEIHYIVVIGGLVWGTTQFGSYAVFGHRRPLNAVVVMGLPLLANMAITNDQLPYLIAYTAASLFLLIGMHAFDERATWVRRRIGDPGTISALYLRGGTVFVLVALVGSLFLTYRAASAPLAGAWDGVDDQLIAFGERISRYLPVGGDLRAMGGVQFGQDARISDTWFTDAGIAFTATVPASEDEFKWRAAAYDTFGLTGWTQSFPDDARVDAGQPLLADTSENPSEDWTRPVTATVRPADYQQGLLLSPGAPVSVNQAADVVTTGTGRWFAKVETTDHKAPYTVTGRVIEVDSTQEKLTGNLLEVAGETYPAEIRALYTQVPDGAMGDAAKELLAAIIADAGTTNPYRLAVAMQEYLREKGGFVYDPDLTNNACDAASKVECFARTKHGYCLHYASTMAILLRAANPTNPIPTRLVQGFLPGTWQNGSVTVENRDAHAWVEVYFPNYGWIPFDPTGGGVGRPTVIVEGPKVPPPSFVPSLAPDDRLPDPTRRVDGDTGNVPTNGSTPGGPGNRALLILLTVLLAVAVLAVAIAAWVRGPRGEVTPDAAWRSMSGAASRFGFGPRPTQTVYEYANSLGELVPAARADLDTVATAKVETAYAGVRIGGARLDAVRDATRRLRISLLRLVFRRPRRRRRGSGVHTR